MEEQATAGYLDKNEENKTPVAGANIDEDSDENNSQQQNSVDEEAVQKDNSPSEDANPRDQNYHFYKEYCRLYYANIILTNRLQQLLNEKQDLGYKLTILEVSIIQLKLTFPRIIKESTRKLWACHLRSIMKRKRGLEGRPQRLPGTINVRLKIAQRAMDLREH